MMRYRVALDDAASYALPTGLRELALMEDVQKLVGLQGVEVEAVAAHELERVPGLRVVPGGYRDSAVRAEPLDRELKARRRTDAQVYGLATRSEQARENGRAHHRPRRARVAADE